MKVIVKFIDPAGQEYYYPKPEPVSGFPTHWRISALTPNALMLARVIDDTDGLVTTLGYISRLNGCRMELIPAQSILGTYLSTYTDKERIINKLVRIYIVTLPIILFILSLIILKQSVS